MPCWLLTHAVWCSGLDVCVDDFARSAQNASQWRGERCRALFPATEQAGFYRVRKATIDDLSGVQTSYGVDFRAQAYVEP